LHQWSKPKRKNAKAAVTAAVIAVSVADATVAEIAMTVATVATVAIAMIAATEKTAMTVAMQPNAKVAMTVARAVARARKVVRVIVNSVTQEHRKVPLLRRMQRSMAHRIRPPPQDHHASQEKPASRANHVLIAANVASALSVAHAVNAVIVPSAHRATLTQPTQRPQLICR
jgi:hypothetical protein